MSIQFGSWNFDGRPLDPDFIRHAARLTERYGGDAETAWTSPHIMMAYRPFHTIDPKQQRPQPLHQGSGIVLSWDGRLDNKSALLRRLCVAQGETLTDAEIILACYEQWDTACFREILGDWALTIWDERKQSLFLAKDFVGTRHLFYCREDRRITWCSVLDPLVFLVEPLRISEEFIAGYLSTFPSKQLTPFTSVLSVPASCFVKITPGSVRTEEYWRFDPQFRVKYRTDAEYEEHFRCCFSASIRRRLRSSFPVLAELSGGMDSSSIVCMADRIIAEGGAETPRLDTISYYNDEEPNWNEQPYFSRIEFCRGRQGYHIDLAASEGVLQQVEREIFFQAPGHDAATFYFMQQFGHCLASSGSRAVLSGIGGDEFLGGVPNCLLELRDLLVSGHWIRLTKRLIEFSLERRRACLHLACDMLEDFLPQRIRRLYKRKLFPPWLEIAFARRNRKALWQHLERTRLSKGTPSFQANIAALDHLRRQLNATHLESAASHRLTYPYLDRELLAFLFAIPRDQLVRPGQRRSLMRRALVDIVPPEILGRKRKAFVARQPIALIDAASREIARLLEAPYVAGFGWMDRQALFEEFAATRRGAKGDCSIAILTSLRLELWIRQLFGDLAVRALVHTTGQMPSLESLALTVSTRNGSGPDSKALYRYSTGSG